MAVDFRVHPMFQQAGFKAPSRFEADVYDCEVWGKIPTDIGAISTGCNATSSTGMPTTVVFLPNHSHLSETYAVGTADESMTAPILQFIQALPR